MRHALIVLLLLSSLGSSAAQYTDDEQERDHAEQDRRYYERYVERAGEGDADALTDRDAFIARAEELIHDRQFHSDAGPHYTVKTDDPRLDPGAVVALLESFRVYFDGFWRAGPPLQPFDEQSPVYLFYSFAKYNELLQLDFRFSARRPKGHYTPELDLVCVHTDADAPGGLGDTLIHEAAHQLVEQRIYGGDSSAGLWVAEGLATYFGFTRTDKEGRLESGAIGGKALPLFRDGGTKGMGRAARDTLRNFRRQLKTSASDAGVHWLLSIRQPGRFYGDEASFNYAASWVLVHYLLDGDEGRHRAAFVRFLEADKRGEGTPERLYRETGLDRDALEAAVRDHAAAMKPR